MPQGEFIGKPINKVPPFCPGAAAEGMAGPGSAVQAGSLTRKRGKELYGSMVRASQKQVLYLSAAGLSNRKEGTTGQKRVRKTSRAANSGPCPKGRDGKCTPRSPYQHVSSFGRADDSRLSGSRFESGICSQRVYGFRKENQLIVLQDEHL